MPVVKMLAYGASAALLLISAVGAYYSIISRIDRMDERMANQSETLKSLSGSIQKLAEEALTASDLKAACMQMQIANQGKGWVCPFSGVEVKVERRRLVRSEISATPK